MDWMLFRPLDSEFTALLFSQSNVSAAGMLLQH